MEEWRPVPISTKHDVSSLGRVRSWAVRGHANAPRPTVPKILRQDRDRYGYLHVMLNNKRYTVHTLVLTAFSGLRPDPTMLTRHLNNKRDDNRPENLVWGTPKENQDDRRVHGTTISGEQVHNAKLTQADVDAIRASTETQVALGKRYGVRQATISRIILKQAWVPR